MIFVIMGKSATGKDTVFSRLLADKELGLRKIVPYTTRPIRVGEVNGREYYFVDEERMNELQKQGKVVEHRQYETVHGLWHYFTVDDNDDVRSDDTRYLMIATLEAYVQLCRYYGRSSVVPIYIEVEDFERIRRALRREKRQDNPNCEEVCRRYLADERDFSKELLSSAGIEKSFLNHSMDECVDNIRNEIKNH